MDILVISDDYEQSSLFDIENKIFDLPYILSYDLVIFDLSILFTDNIYLESLEILIDNMNKFVKDIRKKTIFLYPDRAGKNCGNFKVNIKVNIDDMYEDFYFLSDFMKKILGVNPGIKYFKSTLYDYNSDECEKVLGGSIDSSDFIVEKYYGYYSKVKESNHIVVANLTNEKNVVITPYIYSDRIKDFINLIFQKTNINFEAPIWAKDYLILEELQKNKIKNESQKKIELLNSEIREIDKYLNWAQKIKSVLFTSGTALEDSVKYILQEMGFHFEKRSLNNRVDLVLTLEGYENIVVEIKGRKNKSSNEKDVMQVVKWVADEYLHINYEPKGLLIMNAFFAKTPEERQEPFPQQVEKTATQKNIVLLDTVNLLELHKLISNKDKTMEQVYKMILKSNGIFKL